jgi:hypothetical protein
VLESLCILEDGADLTLSRYNTNGSEDHIKAMHRAMHHAIATPNRGIALVPDDIWNGDPKFEFSIVGVSDASYKPHHDTALSVGGHAVFLNGAAISEKSKIQQSTTLPVTKGWIVFKICYSRCGCWSPSD